MAEGREATAAKTRKNNKRLSCANANASSFDTLRSTARLGSNQYMTIHCDDAAAERCRRLIVLSSE